MPRACPGGGSTCATYGETVRQAVVLILTTPPGTRPLKPEFGCALHTLLFRPFTAALVAQMKYFVTSALERWGGLDVGADDVVIGRESGGGVRIQVRCQAPGQPDLEVTLRWDGGAWAEPAEGAP